jgi:isopenicillin N synthase-like dioxygenase
MSKQQILPGQVTPLDDTPYEDCPWIHADELAISMKSADFASQLDASLHAWGFAAVSDYGFPTKMIDDSVAAWHKFFTSSKATKAKWQYNNVNEIGWVPPGSGSSLSTMPDKKEYCSVKPYHPSFSLPRIQNRKTVIQLVKNLEEVGLTILDAIEDTCPVDFPYLRNLREKTKDCQHLIQRVNYFPPASEDDDPRIVPAGKHTDLGIVTVLVPAPDDCPGLVLWDRTGKKWRVPYMENTLVINVGDIMSILTGGTLHFTGRGNYANGKIFPDGYYPSTLHGVDRVDSRDKDRITIPVFLHMKDEHLIADKSQVFVSMDQAEKGPLANEQVIDIQRAMHMKGGLTGAIFRDARLGNHGINKKVESAEGFTDADNY